MLIAPFLIVAAITSGLYALSPLIERVVYGDILFVDTAGQALPLRDQAAAAQAAFPDLAMTGMRPAATDFESTRIYIADPRLDEESMRAVFVDPHTGRVLGDEATWLGYLPVSTWLDGFHRQLNLGEPGRNWIPRCRRLPITRTMRQRSTMTRYCGPPRTRRCSFRWK